jgi:nucleotide-binding universal stress UspA family protein
MIEFRPTRILTAVDLGALSELVAGAATRLAEVYRSSLDIIVAQPVEAPLEFTPDQIGEIARAQRRDLHALEQQLRRWSEGRVPASAQLRVLPGAPVEVILRQSEGADLIVTGTHARSGLSRWRLGSVSEGVVRGARVPVLVVHEIHGLPASMRPRLLCPVNFTPVSNAALAAALSLAAALDGQLTVMTSAETEGETEARLQAACVEARAGAPECAEPRLVVRRGQAAEQILQLAEEEQSDLIVLGAERRASLSEALFGGTTEHLLHHLPTSLLVVPGSSNGPVPRA